MRYSFLICLFSVEAVSVGNNYSGDNLHEFPMQWRGYLPDQRMLRQCIVTTTEGRNSLRDRYADDALALEGIRKDRALTADESADLGALYIRLGLPLKAIDLLRPALRAHPKHFRVAANLGSAWQAANDLEQAGNVLEEAITLAPKEHLEAEQLHLKLVKLRMKEPRGSSDLDDLFDMKFIGEMGEASPNTMAAEQKKKLPETALAQVQRLAFWLPNDARLLWLLAEIANAHGDVRTAANILDGCITELGLKSVEARKRRQVYRAAADQLEKDEKHSANRGTLKFASPRIFQRILNVAKLPKINPQGVNRLPWAALSETTISNRFEVSYLKYVDQLDGKRISLTGFMVLNGQDSQAEFLLVENAIGCWFCEQPSPTQLLVVRMKEGTTADSARRMQSITGTLKLNRDDPEAYLFTITDATISGVE